MILDDNIQLQKMTKETEILLNEYTSLHAKPTERKPYLMSLLTLIKIYEPLGSFGELALITDKRRAAKLEVTDDGDAHFAIL